MPYELHHELKEGIICGGMVSKVKLLTALDRPPICIRWLKANLSILKAFVQIVLLLVFSGSAFADVFVFDGRTDPITGTYISVFPGHFDGLDAIEKFGTIPQGADPFDLPSTITGAAFFISQGETALDPSTSLCVLGTPIPGSRLEVCRNYFAGATLDTNPSITLPLAATEGVSIVNQKGDPLAVMVPMCGPDNTCDVLFFAESGGSAIDLSAAPLYLRDWFATYPAIVANGGIQDAIDMNWEDGTSDSFEFIMSPVPEVSSTLLIGTIAIILYRAGQKNGAFLRFTRHGN